MSSEISGGFLKVTSERFPGDFFGKIFGRTSEGTHGGSIKRSNWSMGE